MQLLQWSLILLLAIGVCINGSSIHRFFDSSPFSPSGQYVAFATLPKWECTLPSFKNSAQIVIKDILRNTSVSIANTFAWDSQVGAHVQWGRTDRDLFYNVLVKSNGSHSAIGTKYDMFKNIFQLLSCPVYHVFGNFGISPDLAKIHHTQLGYGVNFISSTVNARATRNDGIYLTDFATGECSLLVSLYDCAVAAGLDTMTTPTYGFHTKWSFDGNLILFVMRTLEESAGIFGVFGKRIRRQHLFVISRDGRFIRHVISWSSKPFKSRAVKTNEVTIHELDGNHPNWVPNSYKISMNYAVVGGSSKWTLVTFDVCCWTHRVGLSSGFSLSCVCKDAAVAGEQLAKEHITSLEVPGSGHPAFHKDGRYVICDAYAKELRHEQFDNTSKSVSEAHAVAELHDVSSDSSDSDMVTTYDKQMTLGLMPLRLLDTVTRREAVLAWVPITRRDGGQCTVLSREQRNAWRCDAHPAWSRDFRKIAVNARPGGGDRQVLWLSVRYNLSSYFD